MKLWKWQAGRQQGCEYWKFPLWYFRIGKWGFDAYILKYQAGTFLPYHTDPVDGKHWRVNLEVVGKSLLAVRKSDRIHYYRRAAIFRSDLYEHALQVSSKGCTKLSFGFVKFN